ncbi:MAG: insulinase family protein [Candidatus Kerfeldbacteria bacterium]|nr:insulinase family protein [Candidatus Kerfeldbacteria bacterium]
MPRQFTLPNGIRVLLLPEDGKPFAGIAVGLHHGSGFESSERAGLAHLAEHMTSRATKSYPTWRDLGVAFGLIGKGPYAETSKTTMIYSGKTFPRFTPQALSIVGEMLTAPVITQDHLEQESGRAIDELRSFSDVLDDELDYELDRFLLEGDPRGKHTLGTEDTISSCSLGDLRGLHRTIVRGRRMVIVVAGRFSVDRVMQRIDERFTAIPPGQPRKPFAFTPTQRRRNIIMHRHDMNLIMGRIGFIAPGLSDPLRIPLAVLNKHLGGHDASALSLALLAEGKLYTTSSCVWHYFDVGYLWVSFEASPECFYDVLGAIMGELRAVRQQPISALDLELAKRQLRMDTSEKFLNPYETATFYARLLLENGSDFLLHRAYLHAVQQVTRGDVLRAARQTFHTSRMSALFGGATHGLRKGRIERILRFR